MDFCCQRPPWFVVGKSQNILKVTKESMSGQRYILSKSQLQGIPGRHGHCKLAANIAFHLSDIPEGCYFYNAPG